MKNLKSKSLLTMLMVLALLVATASMAFASFDAFLVKADDGKFYEYNQAELNNSFLLFQAKGATDPGAAMYNQFLTVTGSNGKVVALGDSTRGWMDYEEASVAHLKAIIDEVDFVINDYLALPASPVYGETVTNPIVVNPDGTLTPTVDLAAYEAARAQAEAVVAADYTATTYAALQTALTDNVVDGTNTQIEIDAATAAINAAIDALVFAGQADLDAAKTAAAAKVEADYTADSFAALTTALALPEATNAEVVAKTTAINDAYAALVEVLKVESVSAITSTYVEVTFDALTEAQQEVTVEVKDNTGAVVEVVATDLAAGATFAQFNFVEEYEADQEGVWTVNGQSYNFDDLAQAAAIVEAANNGDQVALYNLLTEAGILNVDAELITEYLGTASPAVGIVGATEKETLADIQAIIDEVNADSADADADAAAVKAVVEAKNQLQLLAALQNGGFDRVNSAWSADYAAGSATAPGFVFVAGTPNANTAFEDVSGTITAVASNAIDADKVRKVIDDVNMAKIVAADGAATNDTAAEQAAVTALIEAWVEADDPTTPTVTPKADLIEASKIKEAAFKVVEATTQVNLYNALTGLAGLSDTLDTFVVGDLNSNLRTAYLTELNATNVRTTQVSAVRGIDVTNNTTIATAVNGLEAAIVTAADTTELAAATTAAFALDANSTTTQIKAALQRLADVTAHKTGAANKFDMSVVRDDQLRNYVDVTTAGGDTIDGFDTNTTTTVQVANDIVAAVNGAIAQNEALEVINDVDASATDVRAALLELAIITIDANPAAGAVEEATRFVDLSPQARLEVAELVTEARVAAGSGSTNDFDFDAVNDQTATTGNGAGAMTDAMDAHDTRIGHINGLGDLDGKSTSAVQAALTAYDYDAFNDLSTVNKIAVAEAFLAETTMVDGDGDEVPRDFSAAEKPVKTFAEIDALIDAAITAAGL